jgi:hypothetical protein
VPEDQAGKDIRALHTCAFLERHSTELRDVRLVHGHQWVRMWTRMQNALQAIALSHRMARDHPRRCV